MNKKPLSERLYISGLIVCPLISVALLTAVNTGSAEVPVQRAIEKSRISEIQQELKIIPVEKNTNYVNVMDSQMPAIPSFPKLVPHSGKVSGYVKDWTGKPLAGAAIGVRFSYLANYYSGGQTKTNAAGYYELTTPKGTAEFYNAGYQIRYGDGIAAVSLHPADGKSESWTTSDGMVENFVLLPYGITSSENLQQNPKLPSSYYGGALILNWYGVEADDSNAPDFAIKEGSLVEISLTPDAGKQNGFIIRKTAGAYGELRILNIPTGIYTISIKVNGKKVKIKDTRKNNPGFGLIPAEGIGNATVVFVPANANPTMVAPQLGAWEWVNLSIEMLVN